MGFITDFQLKLLLILPNAKNLMSILLLYQTNQKNQIKYKLNPIMQKKPYYTWSIIQKKITGISIKLKNFFFSNLPPS